MRSTNITSGLLRQFHSDLRYNNPWTTGVDMKPSFSPPCEDGQYKLHQGEHGDLTRITSIRSSPMTRSRSSPVGVEQPSGIYGRCNRMGSGLHQLFPPVSYGFFLPRRRSRYNEGAHSLGQLFPLCEFIAANLIFGGAYRPGPSVVRSDPPAASAQQTARIVRAGAHSHASREDLRSSSRKRKKSARL